MESGPIDGQMDPWTDGHADRRSEPRTDEWTQGWMDRQLDP